MNRDLAQILAIAALTGMPAMTNLLPTAAKPRVITPEDVRRQQKAQDKRDRRAAKRMKGATDAS